MPHFIAAGVSWQDAALNTGHDLLKATPRETHISPAFLPAELKSKDVLPLTYMSDFVAYITPVGGKRNPELTCLEQAYKTMVSSSRHRPHDKRDKGFFGKFLQQMLGAVYQTQGLYSKLGLKRLEANDVNRSRATDL